MRNSGKTGKYRQPGGRGRFVVTMDNETFNAINKAAVENGRSFSSEAEHRLNQSMTALDKDENPERISRDGVARMQLEMLGAAMGSAFALTAVARADDRGRSPGYAVNDVAVLAEAIAAATRVIWNHTLPEDDIARLSAALAERLPKF